MSLKVFVQFTLYVGNTETGNLNPAGARLLKGGEWPHELTDKDGKLVFTFADVTQASRAAKALERYLEKNP